MTTEINGTRYGCLNNERIEGIVWLSLGFFQLSLTAMKGMDDDSNLVERNVKKKDSGQRIRLVGQ